MWRFDTAAVLIGCGVDAERIERFDKFSTGTEPWSFVFSPREVEHIRSLDSPSRGFCASFCCKEGVLKAVQESYSFPDCEFFYTPGLQEQPVHLSGKLRRRHAVKSAFARLEFPVDGEILSVVYLLGGER